MLQSEQHHDLFSWLQTIGTFGQFVVAAVGAAYLIKYTKETTRMRQHTAAQLNVAEAPYAPKLVPSAEYFREAPADVLQSASLEVDAPYTRVRVENAGDTAIRPFAIAKLDNQYFADYGKEGIAHKSFEDFFMGKRFTHTELKNHISDRIGKDAVEPLDKLLNTKGDFFGIICRDNLMKLHWPIWSVEVQGTRKFTIPSIVERLPRV